MWRHLRETLTYPVKAAECQLLTSDPFRVGPETYWNHGHWRYQSVSERISAALPWTWKWWMTAIWGRFIQWNRSLEGYQVLRRQSNSDLTTNENILSILMAEANDLHASVGCYQDAHQDIWHYNEIVERNPLDEHLRVPFFGLQPTFCNAYFLWVDDSAITVVLCMQSDCHNCAVTSDPDGTGPVKTPRQTSATAQREEHTHRNSIKWRKGTIAS